MDSITSLFELEANCHPDKPDAAFWQWVAAEAARELFGTDGTWVSAIHSLKSYRMHDWNHLLFQNADAAVAGEINLFLTRVMKEEDMPKTPAKNSTKNSASVPETNSELLAWSLGACFNQPPNGKELRALQENGATDDQLFDAIVTEWATPNVGSVRRYYAEATESDLSIWFDTDVPEACPSLHYDKSDGQGALLNEVRKVLGIARLETDCGSCGDRLSDLAQAVRDHALRMLLHPTAAEAGRWKDFANLNMPTDGNLLVHLNELWKTAVSRKNPDCCAAIRQGKPLVWFGQSHSKGTPSLSGSELYDAIRRVLGMTLTDEEFPLCSGCDCPQGECTCEGCTGRETPIESNLHQEPSTKNQEPASQPAFDQLKRKGKSKPKEPESAEPTNWMAAVKVIDERDVPWEQIVRSKENPRQSFDPELIASMEPTIETICQLDPLTVREGTFEIIDGETRHRAAEKRKPALRCKIVRCSDEIAAEIRILTSLQRRDLNPIERAQAIIALQMRHNMSQRQLQKVVKLKQGSISKLTRIVQLPEKWQKLVISRRITQSDAEALVPYKDEPGVLKRVEDDLDNVCPSYKFEDVLKSCVEDASAPIVAERLYHKGRTVTFSLKPTPEQREQLRIRESKNWQGQPEERAFNLELWEKLVDEQLAKKSQKLDSAKGADASVDPKKAAENAKKKQEQLAKRLYRWRTAWYQVMCRAEVSEANVGQNSMLALLLFLSGQSGGHRRIETLAKQVKVKTTYRGETDEKLLTGLQKAADAAASMQTVLIEELSAPFDGYDSTLLPEEIHALAAAWGVSIDRDWTTSFDEGMPAEQLWSDFCDLWSKDQILELLDEWKIKRPDRAESMKRSELVKLLRADKGCPAAIAKAKAVRLF